MKLILLTPPETMDMEILRLCDMFEAGLELCHVRKPDFGIAEMRAFLKSIPEAYHDRLVLHAHHELADEFRLKGLHYNKAVPFEAKKEELTSSASMHAFEELENNSLPLDYVFLSPVFDSISKNGYRSAFDPEVMKAYLTAFPRSFDVIALGGICSENVKTAGSLGFNGVAALGAVWMSADPFDSFLALKEKCASFREIKYANG